MKKGIWDREWRCDRESRNRREDTGERADGGWTCDSEIAVACITLTIIARHHIIQGTTIKTMRIFIDVH